MLFNWIESFVKSFIGNISDGWQIDITQMTHLQFGGTHSTILQKTRRNGKRANYIFSSDRIQYGGGVI